MDAQGGQLDWVAGQADEKLHLPPARVHPCLSVVKLEHDSNPAR